MGTLLHPQSTYNLYKKNPSSPLSFKVCAILPVFLCFVFVSFLLVPVLMHCSRLTSKDIRTYYKLLIYSYGGMLTPMNA